jgi:protocatechuate 3,4-dioxygenase beta subunit
VDRSAANPTRGLGGPALPAIVAVGGPIARAAETPRAPTPSCADGDADPTIRQTEGPYFKPRSPERISLSEPGITGVGLVLTGVVLSTACRPVAGALLDFWHADADGRYDNAGYRLRGHQFTDAQGRYTLTTILPGAYQGRTRHIHVKVQPAGRPVLTTQLYFPGERGNEADGLFRRALLVAMSEAEAGKAARFDFVVPAA